MSEEIDVDVVEKMRMRYKKEAQIAIEQAYQRGRDEGNEELEDKLRTRFRKEAQIAVENAYQRGKQEVANEIQNSSSLKDAEEEIKKWKAICESLGHSPSGKHITLVKFLMEQVYRDIKREFTEEAEVMERMKRVLLISTSKLTEKLPQLVLSVANDNIAPPVKDKNESVIVTVSNYDRPQSLRFPPPPQTSEITVNIISLKYIEYPAKKMFTKGYVSFLIHSKVTRNQDPKGNSETSSMEYFQERRYSEFVALLSKLQLEYPKCIIPPLPPKMLTVEVKDIREIGHRKRHLHMWLQFVFLHSHLQNSSTLKIFILSDNKIPDFWNKAIDNSFNALQNTIYEHDDVAHSDRVDREIATDKGLEHMLASSRFSGIYKSNCLKAIHSVSRDFRQLKPNINVSIEAVTSLLQLMAQSIQAKKSFSDSLKFLSISDNDSEVEKQSLTAVHQCMERSFSHLIGIDAATNIHVNETVHFYEHEAMASAKILVDDANGVHNTESVLLLDYKKKVTEEWSIYRNIRKECMLHELLAFANRMESEHASLKNLWSTSHHEISQLNPDHDDCLGVARGWRGIVTREFKELDDIYSDMKEAHLAKKRVQDVFSSAAALLARDRGGFTANQYDNATSVLNHSIVSDRPTIPKGARREPNQIFEKIREVYDEDCEAEIPLDESEGEEVEEEDKYHREVANPFPPHRDFDITKRLNVQESYNVDSQMKVSADDERYSESFMYPSRMSSTDKDASTAPRPPSYAMQPVAKPTSKSLWKSFFWRSTNTPQTMPTQDVNDANAGGGEESNDEDTPMNRAYKNQLQKQHLQDIEEQERIITEDKLKERSRRSKPNAVSQRRPKPKSTGNTANESSYTIPTPPPPVPQKNSESPAPPEPKRGKSAQDNTSSHLANAAASKVLRKSSQETNNSDAYSNTTHTNEKRQHSENVDITQQNSPQYLSPDTNVRRKSQSDLPADAQTSNSRRNSHTNPNANQFIEALPSGWEEVSTPTGETYFYHKVTRISRWDRPTQKVASAMEQRLNESQRQVDEAVERRKAERAQNRQVESEIAQYAEQLKATVQKSMSDWKQPPGTHSPRGLGELLNNIPALLGPVIAPAGSISSTALTNSSTPAEIKKAYLKAVRLVHPDKLSGVIVDMEKKLLAQEVFIAINQIYDTYRKTHGL